MTTEQITVAGRFNGPLDSGNGGYSSQFTRVQFLQLNNVRATRNILVAWNEVINEPRQSRVEDNINLYLSSGTPDSPIVIRNNYIRAGEDFIMQQIPDGNYYLKALFGNDWNDSLLLPGNNNVRGGFKRNARYEIFQQQINIIQMQHSRSGDTLIQG